MGKLSRFQGYPMQVFKVFPKYRSKKNCKYYEEKSRKCSFYNHECYNASNCPGYKEKNAKNK